MGIDDWTTQTLAAISLRNFERMYSDTSGDTMTIGNTESDWTTIRVSKRFKAWLEHQGIFGEDKSLFDIVTRLLNWTDKEDGENNG